jgi:septal ring factor EnvC (AmiA/AmiB activator)
VGNGTELTGWLAAAFAILSLILTWVLNYRKDKREDRHQERQGDMAEESVAIGVQQKVIDQLTARVGTLEQQMLAAHESHLECVRDKEQLRGELNVVKEQLEALKRHEKNNVQQIEVTKAAIAKIEAKGSGE